MWKTLQDTGARGLEPAVLLANFWHHCIETNKCTTLEFTEVLSIAGTALGKNNDRIKVACCFSKFDPLRDLLLEPFLVSSRFSIYKQALRSSYSITHEGNVGCLFLGDETGNLLPTIESGVQEGRVIADYTSYIPHVEIRDPIWSQILLIRYVWLSSECPNTGISAKENDIRNKSLYGTHDEIADASDRVVLLKSDNHNLAEHATDAQPQESTKDLDDAKMTTHI